MNHLAIYSRNRSKDYITMMLLGTKTVDVKLSYRKMAPYKKLAEGDVVYIKESAGPIVGRFTINKVKDVEIINPNQILDMLFDIRDEVGLETDEAVLKMYNKVMYKKYMTIFWFENPEKLVPPIKIIKSDRRVWVPDYNIPDEIYYSF